jgi:hypothetical protein
MIQITTKFSTISRAALRSNRTGVLVIEHPTEMFFPKSSA